MNRATLCLSIAIAAALGSACSRRLGDFSSLSNRTPGNSVHKGPIVTGRDCTWMLFAIPLGEMTLEEAIDAAMASDPRADALTDVTIRRTGWWFGKNCYEVTGALVGAGGRAVSTSSAATPPDDWP